MSRIVWKKVNGWDWDWNFMLKKRVCDYKQKLTMHNIQKNKLQHETRYTQNYMYYMLTNIRDIVNAARIKLKAPDNSK